MPQFLEKGLHHILRFTLVEANFFEQQISPGMACPMQSRLLLVFTATALQFITLQIPDHPQLNARKRR